MFSNEVRTGIQYVGVAGITSPCVNAVLRYLQFGDRITEARLLTCGTTHALALKTDRSERIAVRTGFGSGYSGEAPRGLSTVLHLLLGYGIDVTEIHVTRGMMKRLDSASLTQADLRRIDAPSPAIGGGVYAYVDVNQALQGLGFALRAAFPPVVPLGLIDERLADLAISFWECPDDSLMQAYRRLEDAVRERTGINAHGAKLFSQAFLGARPRLIWPNAETSEQTARGQVFASAFGAFRNPRAHRQMKESTEDQLAEFLTVNHLFRLEDQAELAAEGGASGEDA